MTGRIASTDIWSAPAGAVITPVASGQHWWFTTPAPAVGTFTSTSTDVPLAAWLPITLNHSFGRIKTVVVEWHGQITASTETGTMTAAANVIRVGAYGLSSPEKPTATNAWDQKPAIQRLAQSTMAINARAGASFALSVAGRVQVAGTGATNTVVESALTWGSSVGDSWPFIDDASAPAAGDFTDGRLVIGVAIRDTAGVASSVAQTIDTILFEKIYVAIKFVTAVVTAVGGSVTIAGQLTAHQYCE
jgi:hypothetical protein